MTALPETEMMYLKVKSALTLTSIAWALSSTAFLSESVWITTSSREAGAGIAT